MHKALKKYFPVFVLPTLIAFTFAFLLPFIVGIYLSFCDFTTIIDAEFVGLKNYSRMLQHGDFIQALKFTGAFTVLAVISVNVFAFILALGLTKGIKGTNLYRSVFFMPNLIGGIVLGYIWKMIIDGVLLSKGMTIVSDPKYGFWGLVILMNWQMIGYMMIIYITGIQNISPDLLEAAEIDGATRFQAIRKIVMPMMMPSFTICLFLTLTNSFKLFDQNLALTAGAPGRKTQMLALDIYNTFYGRPGWEGVGQAKAVVFFLLLGVVALIQLRATRSKEVEN